MIFPKSVSAVLLLLIILVSPGTMHGQGEMSSGGSGGRIEGDFSFRPLPYVNYNRTLGFSFGAIPMAMFNPVSSDTLSPSSLAGLLGIYTTNKTWFAMGFSQMYFGEGDWRVGFGGGFGSLNSQFYLDYPVNDFVPYNTLADILFMQVQRRVFNKIFAGANYTYVRYETTTDLQPESELSTHHGLGVKLSWDGRTDVYYPRSGSMANAAFTVQPAFLGNDFISEKIQLDYSAYFSFAGDRDVLAVRASAGIGLGDLSFNQQFVVGNRDIRGYSQGAYRGNTLLAAQAEYRWNVLPSWGAVGFAGLATVYKSINASDDGRLLPGAGVGFRFTAFEETRMNIGLDAAVGKGDWGVYFRIGEAI